MALNNSFTNLFNLFSAMSPLLLSFFLVMSSLFNQNIKGLIYLAGVLISVILNTFLMTVIGSKRTMNTESYTCNVFNLSNNEFNSPAPTSLFIAFTIAYLVLPMIYNAQLNYVVIAALLSLFVIDGITKVNKNCTTGPGTVIGGLVGLFLGAVWYSIFHISGYDSLLYFDELASNRVLCSKPSKQTFKCSVFKGGQLISSNIV
jgi:prepilin signal peptidase PulO-like enzyme (type II secretory pathway)